MTADRSQAEPSTAQPLPAQPSTAVPPLARDARVHAWLVSITLSRTGDMAWYVALAWTAAHVAGPAGVGLVMGVDTLPRALLTLVGGALADRWDARRTMVVADAARVVVLLAGFVAVTARGPSLPILVAVALAFGVFDALHDPAASTMPRQMVREDDLGPFFGLMQIGYRVAGFVGAPLGGLLVAQTSIRGVMVLDAVTFAVAGVVVATLLRPRFPRERSSGASVRADLVDGIAYLRRSRPVRTLVVALSGLNLFVGPVLAVGLVLRTKDAGWSSSDLGLFEATSAVAAALAALAVLRWKPRRPARTGLLVLVAQAAACVTIGFAPFLGVVVSMATVGATAGLASSFLSAAFQRTVAPTYLGRSSSLVSLADDLLMPLATIGFGALAAGADVATACALTGAGFAALVLWSALRPGLDVAPADSSRGRRRAGAAAEAARAVGSREPAQM